MDLSTPLGTGFGDTRVTGRCLKTDTMVRKEPSLCPQNHVMPHLTRDVIAHLLAQRMDDDSGHPIGHADGLRRMPMIVFFYVFM